MQSLPCSRDWTDEMNRSGQPDGELSQEKETGMAEKLNKLLKREGYGETLVKKVKRMRQRDKTKKLQFMKEVEEREARKVKRSKKCEPKQ